MCSVLPIVCVCLPLGLSRVPPLGPPSNQRREPPLGSRDRGEAAAERDGGGGSRVYTAQDSAALQQ